MDIKYHNSSMEFDRKGYGRIFVEKEEDIQKVEDIMKEIDEEEFECYYPTGNHFTGKNCRLVTVFNEENCKSVYVAKFDSMDIGQVLKEAWSRGIHCFAIFGKMNQFDGE